MTGDDFFVGAPEDRGRAFSSTVWSKEGMDLALLESTDIVADTRKAVEEKVRQQEGPLLLSASTAFFGRWSRGIRITRRMAQYLLKIPTIGVLHLR